MKINKKDIPVTMEAPGKACANWGVPKIFRELKLLLFELKVAGHLESPVYVCNYN